MSCTIKLIDQPEISVQPNSAVVFPSTSKLHSSTGNENMHTIPSVKIVQTDKSSQVSASFSLLKVPQISVKKKTLKGFKISFRKLFRVLSHCRCCETESKLKWQKKKQKRNEKKNENNVKGRKVRRKIGNGNYPQRLNPWIAFSIFVTASQHFRNTPGKCLLLLHYFLSSAPGLSPMWPSPPERRVSWLRGIVQDTGDTPLQR
ncbi:hypothetical protein DPMN_062330 [Dreissena polymorpha]|uniref:Uncharacterized protein n=1 Tax=Dreissena polymorpha TaxID=45954 RepID=A0A9D4HJA4_DREPO|nr:hypothetical protein DPMN_062330 [Dreissena polymorpha]